MLDSDKLAIAAHLHVAMRRKLGRVTDVEWMVRSDEYAREIIRLALAEPDQPDLHHWARRMDEALFAVQTQRRAMAAPAAQRPLPPGPPPGPAPGAAAPAAEPAVPEPKRYIGRLR
ncbi:MAG: hypothetical protein IPG93_12145 [Burkholderiales bacterium]|nr:hypothetical protein [Burkholderiales bacterium]